MPFLFIHLCKEPHYAVFCILGVKVQYILRENILEVIPLEENVRKSHNIIIEDRKKFTLTGVRDVLSFDENSVVLLTGLGKLTIKGEELKLGQFDNSKGDISGEGKIYAFGYSDEETGGFFSRLFK